MTHSHPSGPSTASSRTASDDSDAPYTVAELHDRWVLERLLGSGSQGQVWRARERKAPSNVVAIKCLRDCQDARYEIEAYEQLRNYEIHPHVLDVSFGLCDGCAPRLLAQHTLCSCLACASTRAPRAWISIARAATGRIRVTY